MAKTIKELLNRKTLTPEQIAKKHDVSLAQIKRQLGMGHKVEKEHTKSAKVADEIARDHLGEIPNYYSKLNKAHLEEDIDWDYVFGFLLEDEEEPEWQITPYKHVTEYEHKFTVPTQYGSPRKVSVTVIHNPEKGDHDVAFSVGEEISAREGRENLPAKSRQAAMRGIARAIEHHARNHVGPGEQISAMTSDKDYVRKLGQKVSTEEKKIGVQRIFFTKLARKLGWKYTQGDYENYHAITKPKNATT